MICVAVMCNLFDLLFSESSKPIIDGSLSYGPGAEARLRLGEGQVTRNCKYKCLSFLSSSDVPCKTILQSTCIY